MRTFGVLQIAGSRAHEFVCRVTRLHMQIAAPAPGPGGREPDRRPSECRDNAIARREAARGWAQITQQVIDARVWEGIHFRFSDIAGRRVGSNVAHYDLHHLQSIGL